jgi:hypothetical protein
MSVSVDHYVFSRSSVNKGNAVSLCISLQLFHSQLIPTVLLSDCTFTYVQYLSYEGNTYCVVQNRTFLQSVKLLRNHYDRLTLSRPRYLERPALAEVIP